ncbi:kinase-like domain-containing protein [Aspergillus pseudonomiae]|uniref:Kinase-like domain-containing protein n=1 Tax=Aspergillus pseudonomiae TaxID=1506151 RepID=A0A5N7D468_9EURO|nr:kinase-like domain-containing protein [Aspergillus pseudonomiae]KAE8401195.1 kinase-like domain-containing protein [Aspergillus pseudonomiae]
MDIQRRFPDVHWIWGGGISFVEREQFQKELKIYEIFSRHRPCPYIVQCFLYTDNSIFLEYMKDICLSAQIQNNHIRDQETMAVTKINDLAQAVAYLESLNLAHSDLRPENILLDRDRLKLSNYNCTVEIGTDFKACLAPYKRLLNSSETDQGPRGTSSFLGPQTKQFALGSIYYLINYSFEVYDNQCLTDDPHKHGPKVVDSLQNIEFPGLYSDPLIDDIIDNCWHNKYATAAQLATKTNSFSIKKKKTIKEPGPNAQTVSATTPRGQLDLLSSAEPKQLGLTFEWYRHSS